MMTITEENSPSIFLNSKSSLELYSIALMIDDLKNRHGSLVKHQNEGIKNFTLFGFDNDETKVYG